MSDSIPTTALIPVEVAYALPDCQEIVALDVPQGTTAEAAVALSGLLSSVAAYLPEGEAPPLGIFSRPLNGVEMPLPADYVLLPHDRVEIYRPLLIDPKQARLERASRQKSGQAKKSNDEEVKSS